MIRFIRATARFGKLQKETISFSSGLNVIYGENESGKTTWKEFLIVMIYGISMNERKSTTLDPVKTRYLPWNGGWMEGELLLEKDGLKLLIQRQTQRPEAPMQHLIVREAESGIRRQDLETLDFGEWLTGVPRDIYTQTALVSSGKAEMKASKNLEAIATAVLNGEEEEENTAAALRRIQDEIRRIQKIQKYTKKEENLQVLDEKIYQITRMSEKAEDLKKSQRQLNQEREIITQREKTLRYLNWMEKETLIRKFRERLQSHQKDYQKALESEEYGKPGKERKQSSEKVRKDPYESNPAGRAKVPGWVLGGAGFLTLCAGLINNSTWCIILSAFLLIIAVSLLFYYYYQKNRNLGGTDRTTFEFGEKREENENPQMKLAALELEMNFLREQLFQMETALGPEPEYADGEVLEEESEEYLDSKIEELDTRIRENEKEIAWLQGRLSQEDGITELQRKRQDLIRREEAIAKRLRALELAKNTLQRVEKDRQQKYLPRLTALAGRYLAAFTGERYQMIFLDEEMQPSGKREDRIEYIAAGQTSDGTAQQMYLSIRLALCDLLLGDCPPLIWDDALVLLDDYRCKNVLEVLAEQAEKQQILLFSCHRREWNFVQAMENGALIELEE